MNAKRHLNRILCAILLVGAPLPAHAEEKAAAVVDKAVTEGAESKLSETVDFVFSKMSYDIQYFDRVEKLHQQGRTLPGVNKATFQREVNRARHNLPVLKRFEEEKAGYLANKAPFSLAKASDAHREYRNLITLMNMIQGHRLGHSEDVLEAGKLIVVNKPDDFGQVRGDGSSFYIQMYRQYFYLMGSAYFGLKKDADAVRWFARLEADENLTKLRTEAGEMTSAEDEGLLRLATLRAKPIAVLPFENQTKNEKLGWVPDALLEVLTVDLIQSSDLLVVERGQLATVMEEKALQLAGFVAEDDSIDEVGTALGAGTVLVGSFVPVADKISLSLRIVDVASKEALAGATAEVTEADLFAGSRRALLDALGQLGWDDGILPEELLARHTPEVKTARDLHEARLLASTKKEQAKELYEQAIKNDPALANLYEDLKTEFKDLAATMAVMPFVNIAGSSDDDWLVRGTLEALSTDLPKLDFNIVERAQLATVLEDEAMAEGAFLDADDATRVGTKLKADFMVLGSILHQTPLLRVDMRIVDVKSGLIVFSTSAENRRDDLPATLTALLAAVGERFNRPLDDALVAEMMSSKIDSAQFAETMRNKLREESLEREQKKVELAKAEEAAKPLDWRNIAFWSALGGAGVGSAVAAAGFAMGIQQGDQAVAHNALYQALDPAKNPEAASDQLALRDAATDQANLWTGVGYAGVAVALGSLAWVVVDGALNTLAEDEGAPDVEEGAPTTPAVAEVAR